jgi:hypothetical protein
MKKIFLLTLAFMLVFASNAADIRFQVRRPSVIDVPSKIQSVAIIDRSLQTKESRNKVEESLTGEFLGNDKIASQYALDGLIEMLQNSGRYTVVRTGKQILKNGKANEFPEPLSWDEVNTLCEEFKVDALICLEQFDTDYIIPTSVAFVSVGFRIYDPTEELIIDQNQFRHEIVWGSQVTSVAGAVNRVMEKNKAIRQVSYDAGYMYGNRIAPTWYTIVRQYYRKGKHNQDLKAGARMMEVNDWEAAIELMNSAVEGGKRKAKGRAAHNLAVIYEIKGELPEAKKWAQAAWGKYNNKDSRNYAFLIGERMDEVALVKQQDAN